MQYSFEIFYKLDTEKDYYIDMIYFDYIEKDTEIKSKDKVIFDLAKKYNTEVNSHDFDLYIDTKNKSRHGGQILRRNLNIFINEDNLQNFCNDIPEKYSYAWVQKINPSTKDYYGIYYKGRMPQLDRFNQSDLWCYSFVITKVQNENID